ncbi:SDR family NAD(P)-dependent oxidoreductase [Nocardioides yefusunii]|uniref:SDR family NAD(P)-dependent oxidoreductase n=1 Tax=Nocardioides yefusunii TaxID=2500546 RepID=A0ABW1QWW2_9ACTN|nr:SDR family oxidoreductase [Nocardioides yefusunii]
MSVIDVGFDFSGRHVVVTGGARGTGLEIAEAFRACGARVSVTGTKILPSLYDADLDRFSYHQLQLASSEGIDSFVERIGQVDVLVNAAGARLPGAFDEHEREFLMHSARLGLVGPQRLTQQLRARLCSTAHAGGGAVVHTGQSLDWLTLTLPPAEAEAEFRSLTAQTGRAWSRLGARVNAVLAASRPNLPAQSSWAHRENGGAVITRLRPSATAADLASITLFLASSGARALSGQTFTADQHV